MEFIFLLKRFQTYLTRHRYAFPSMSKAGQTSKLSLSVMSLSFSFHVSIHVGRRFIIRQANQSLFRFQRDD